MQRILFSFIISLFFLTGINAQWKGTVYFSDSVSSQGYISFETTRDGIQNVRLSKGLSGKKQDYPAGKIYGFIYRLDDSNEQFVYRSVNLSNTAREHKVFMRVLYDGEFKLFEMEKGLSSIYFLQDKEKNLIALVSRKHQYREVISRYATGCQQAGKYLKKTSLRTGSLIKFGILYKNCIEEKRK